MQELTLTAFWDEAAFVVESLSKVEYDIFVFGKINDPSFGIQQDFALWHSGDGGGRKKASEISGELAWDLNVEMQRLLDQGMMDEPVQAT
ncbi:hypothetical protein CVT25_011292 [Psilocybe cyanescens]|uniref:Uncharacterized protein n=1 Tax=Psilocybe cyanescens TaxID=93625 RepID=A0A409XCA7_PSICY|nr:hypothetical protein CVT25_011292 [Psilocybe cyanescens]